MQAHCSYTTQYSASLRKTAYNGPSTLRDAHFARVLLFAIVVKIHDAVFLPYVVFYI